MAKKVHPIYKNKAGERVGSVTTILNIMAKPLLIPWANNLGLQGINTKDYVDDLADIGTLAHAMCEEYLTNDILDKSDYTEDQINTAKICLSKFYEWVEKNNPQDCKCEILLVSEARNYAGTCDLYCTINGKRVLVDFKTCKAIYDEMKSQVIAYKDLLEENGYPVDECRILRIGRSEEEGFEEIVISDEEEPLHRERFKACHVIYELNKKIGKIERSLKSGNSK